MGDYGIQKRPSPAIIALFVVNLGNIFKKTYYTLLASNSWDGRTPTWTNMKTQFKENEQRNVFPRWFAANHHVGGKNRSKAIFLSSWNIKLMFWQDPTKFVWQCRTKHNFGTLWAPWKLPQTITNEEITVMISATRLFQLFWHFGLFTVAHPKLWNLNFFRDRK